MTRLIRFLLFICFSGVQSDLRYHLPSNYQWPVIIPAQTHKCPPYQFWVADKCQPIDYTGYNSKIPCPLDQSLNKGSYWVLHNGYAIYCELKTKDSKPKQPENETKRNPEEHTIPEHPTTEAIGNCSSNERWVDGKCVPLEILEDDYDSDQHIWTSTARGDERLPMTLTQYYSPTTENWNTTSTTRGNERLPMTMTQFHSPTTENGSETSTTRGDERLPMTMTHYYSPTTENGNTSPTKFQEDTSIPQTNDPRIGPGEHEDESKKSTKPSIEGHEMYTADDGIQKFRRKCPRNTVWMKNKCLPVVIKNNDTKRFCVQERHYYYKGKCTPYISGRIYRRPKDVYNAYWSMLTPHGPAGVEYSQ